MLKTQTQVSFCLTALLNKSDNLIFSQNFPTRKGKQPA
jgi:hypothetical protein